MKATFGLRLKALDSTDAELIRGWRNDYEVYRWCRQVTLISDMAQRRWMERQDQDPSIQMYRIDWETDGAVRPVGVCGLTSIDYVARRAEFSCYVAPAFRRRGLATAALILLLQTGFEHLNLSQIWGETFEENGALQIFTRLGFQVDGVRRQFYFKDGRYMDAILVSMLRSEWEEKRRGAGPGRADLPDAAGRDGEQRVPGADGVGPGPERLRPVDPVGGREVGAAQPPG